jgi:transposase
VLKEINFTTLAKRETNARKRMRYLALAHFKDGLSRAAIAEALKVSRTSVNKWVSSFLNEGIEGLNDTSPPGRPSGLSLEQKQLLAHYIESHSELNQGGRLQGADIQHYIAEQFFIAYEISNIYRLLRELNFSWITSRSKHPKQSQKAQDVFKKLSNGNDPSHTLAHLIKKG